MRAARTSRSSCGGCACAGGGEREGSGRGEGGGGEGGSGEGGGGEGGEGGGDDDDDDEEEEEVFVAAEVMGGEQILSRQPWRAAAVAPSRAPSDLELVVSSQPPDARLELESVYGNCL